MFYWTKRKTYSHRRQITMLNNAESKVARRWSWLTKPNECRVGFSTSHLLPVIRLKLPLKGTLCTLLSSGPSAQRWPARPHLSPPSCTAATLSWSMARKGVVLRVWVAGDFFFETTANNTLHWSIMIPTLPFLSRPYRSNEREDRWLKTERTKSQMRLRLKIEAILTACLPPALGNVNSADKLKAWHPHFLVSIGNNL